MRTLIIYKSIHHGNTKRVARAIGDVLTADVKDLTEVSEDDVLRYELIGLGSGIYAFRHHRGLLSFANSLPKVERYTFIFSTASYPSKRWHSALRRILQEKGFRILGEFCCRGYNTHSVFRLIGGVNKGRPNEEDLKEAKKFAEEMRERFTQLSVQKDPR